MYTVHSTIGGPILDKFWDFDMNQVNLDTEKNSKTTGENVFLIRIFKLLFLSGNVQKFN